MALIREKSTVAALLTTWLLCACGAAQSGGTQHSPAASHECDGAELPAEVSVWLLTVSEREHLERRWEVLSEMVANRPRLWRTASPSTTILDAAETYTLLATDAHIRGACTGVDGDLDYAPAVSLYTDLLDFEEWALPVDHTEIRARIRRLQEWQERLSAQPKVS